eukprot:TRINITY_DN15747_c0_g1_i4.p1 TRINITY_DN15747_c0_g1~~TRINITY_DN15747_c0_g1_i4.p1  ORF type:complete len:634 (+),score=42.00 TRINITY_DN15747_c0_g1_i4:39-1940(+)
MRSTRASQLEARKMHMHDFNANLFPSISPESGKICIVATIALAGKFCEGSTVKALTLFSGGVEGRSLLTWYRCQPGRAAEIVKSGKLCDAMAEYRLTNVDVGCTIRVQYQAESASGIRCNLKFAETALITAGEPQALNVRLQLTKPFSDLHVGSIISVRFEYCGGDPGMHIYRFVREDLSGHEQTVQLGPNKNYEIRKADEGCWLYCVVTPHRRDGFAGSPEKSPRFPNPVIADCGPPVASDVVISCDNIHIGAVVTSSFSYSGGRPSNQHQHRWIRQRPTDSNEQGDVLEDELGPNKQLTEADMGCRLRYCIRPVRSDGAIGEWTCSPALAIIRGSLARPVIDEKFGIFEGMALQIDIPARFAGRRLRHKWIRWHPPFDNLLRTFEDVVADSLVYIPTAEDVGCKLQYAVRLYRDVHEKPDPWCYSPLTIGQCQPSPIVEAFGFRPVQSFAEGEVLEVFFDPKYHPVAIHEDSVGHRFVPTLQWYRVRPASGMHTSSLGVGDTIERLSVDGPRYLLTDTDVGCYIQVEYLPPHRRQTPNQRFVRRTPLISAAKIPITNVCLVNIGAATLRAALTIPDPSPEGNLQINWFKKDNTSGMAIPLSNGASQREYTATLEDAGHTVYCEAALASANM